jgi:hypothetical protein
MANACTETNCARKSSPGTLRTYSPLYACYKLATPTHPCLLRYAYSPLPMKIISRQSLDSGLSGGPKRAVLMSYDVQCVLLLHWTRTRPRSSKFIEEYSPCTPGANAKVLFRSHSKSIGL